MLFIFLIGCPRGSSSDGRDLYKGHMAKTPGMSCSMWQELSSSEGLCTFPLPENMSTMKYVCMRQMWLLSSKSSPSDPLPGATESSKDAVYLPTGPSSPLFRSRNPSDAVCTTVCFLQRCSLSGYRKTPACFPILSTSLAVYDSLELELPKHSETVRTTVPSSPYSCLESIHFKYCIFPSVEKCFCEVQQVLLRKVFGISLRYIF